MAIVNAQNEIVIFAFVHWYHVGQVDGKTYEIISTAMWHAGKTCDAIYNFFDKLIDELVNNRRLFWWEIGVIYMLRHTIFDDSPNVNILWSFLQNVLDKDSLSQII